MKVLVVGYQKSGKSASKLLKKLGYKVVVVSDDRCLEQNKIDRLIEDLSFIVTSPAVPKESKLLQTAQKHNIKIIGELELGFQNLKGKLIAITGTNGKTTTTSLTSHLLGEENVFVGGNIGIPLSQVCEKTDYKSITVCEVSSFQLDRIDRFRPNISVFLNFSEDHLNYHKTVQNYLDSKLNIFLNQTKKDWAILNADDDLVNSIVPSKVKRLYFSTKKIVNGCYVLDGSIYFRDTTKAVCGYLNPVKIADVSDLQLLGEHNLSNALAGISCAILSGLSPDIIKHRLRTFKPVKHRLEYVTDINGISFINDSKATNTLSTICAIASMARPTTLILGGSDKGCEFDELFASSVVANYVFMGETKFKLALTAKKYGIDNFVLADNLSSAVNRAYNLTDEGEVVLFSPACASFDMFSGYEERGKCFCGIVRELKRNENNRIKSYKKT